MASAKGRAPWQRSFRDIPQTVRKALAGIKGDLVMVAATKRVTLADVTAGLYRHLGALHDGIAFVPLEPIVPPADVGRFSERNVNGWEVVRDDLPMITKSYSWETPNFGDASRFGTHTSHHDREVYQREYVQPPHLAIGAEILRQQEADALIKFHVDSTLDKTRADFESHFLFHLNLLQENTGAAGVFPSAATRQDFLGTIALDWEIFPPGTAAAVVAALTKGRRFTSEGAGVIAERVKLFAALAPRAYLRGTGSFDSYVGAQFADDLVVFENVAYGNALYVLYDGWADISKRSRLELLKGTTQNYDRFPHTEGWKGRFKEHMKSKLHPPKNRRR